MTFLPGVRGGAGRVAGVGGDADRDRDGLVVGELRLGEIAQQWAGRLLHGNREHALARQRALRVTLEDVNFRYPGADEFALKEIALDVEPGQTIALVGPSGAVFQDVVCSPLRGYRAGAEIWTLYESKEQSAVV